MKLVLQNYWRSSSSHRVRIGLAIKGLTYEYVAVNLLKRDQDSDPFTARNPLRQVPLLEVTEDDGTTVSLTQSIAILEYLDDRFPEHPLLPSDPLRRARARQLAEIVNSGIQPFQNLSILMKVKALGSDEIAWAREFISKGLRAYELVATETAGAFSVGDSPTLADCCLVPQLAGARRFGVELANHSFLLRIEERCLELESFKSAAPDRQPDAVK
jgi:maleylpyruvate isomerase